MDGSKPRYPFRLGCTSYVIPDQVIPNVKKMSHLVDDIELVFFESPYNSIIPSKEDIETLGSLASDNDLTYTVHLPIDHKAGSHSVRERMDFVESALHIIELTAPLDPCGYVLHFDGIGYDSPTEEVIFWRSAVNEICVHLNSGLRIDPRLICIENLAYPSEWHLEIVYRFGFSFCFDIGHLWKDRVENWLDIVHGGMSRTRIFHLHGISNGRDHQSLACVPREYMIRMIDQILPLFHGVVTLELFNEKETLDSMKILRDLWER